MTDKHPIQAVYDAIGRAFRKCLSERNDVREIDLIAKLRGDAALIDMAVEVTDARAILAAKRVHRAWRWLAGVLAVALIAETAFFLLR